MDHIMHDIAIPLDTILEMVSGMCPDCQEKVRRYIAQNQFDQRHKIDERLKEIMQRVCEETGVTILEMRAKDNRWRLVEARRKVAVRARQQAISYPKIGAALQKHHTTVMHLVETAS
jgi:chromosomal replication initiation ATPase DnaA